MKKCKSTDYSYLTYFLKRKKKNNQIYFSIPADLKKYFHKNELYSCLSLDGPYIAIGKLSELRKYPWNRVALTKELVQKIGDNFLLSDDQLGYMLSNAFSIKNIPMEITLCLQTYPGWTYYELYVWDNML